jgi:hypothetical protein
VAEGGLQNLQGKYLEEDQRNGGKGIMKLV